MNSTFRAVAWLVGGVTAFLVVALLVLALVVRHTRDELANYRKELETRGEMFDVTAFEPPKSSPENHSGTDLIKIAGKLDRSGSAQWRSSFTPLEKFPGELIIRHRGAFAYRDHLPRVYTPKSFEQLPWPGIESALAPSQPSLAAIRQAMENPSLSIELDYAKAPLDVMHNHPEAWARETSDFFAIDTILQLRNKNTETALDNIETLLRLASAFGRHSHPDGQSTASQLVVTAHYLTWEFLQSHDITSADLTWLQAAWEAPLFSASLADALRMQRAHALQLAETAISEMARDIQFPRSLHEAQNTGEMLAWLYFFHAADLREYLQNIQTLVELMPADQPVDYRKAIDLTTGWNYAANGPRMANAFFAKEAVDLLEERLMTEIWQNLTVTAIALRRFQIAHADKLPSSLEALVPQYLSAIPRDPVDNLPLRYKAHDDSFTLYSIGLNATDDSGAPHDPTRQSSWSLRDRRDIVWPRPAQSSDP